MTISLPRGPIPAADYTTRMETIAEALDSAFNGTPHSPDARSGFVLLNYSFGPGSNSISWITNTLDKDVAWLLGLLIPQLESAER